MTGPAVCHQQRPYFRQQHIQIPVKMLYIGAIHAADLNCIITLDPPGQPAEIPLGADIRTGTHNDHKPGIPGGFDKALDIQPAGKIVYARLRFVEVPRTIGLHAIAADGLELGKYIVPGIGHITEIVYRPGDQPDGAAVNAKIAPDNSKLHCAYSFAITD